MSKHKKNSQDALDRARPRQRLPKKARQAYARKLAVEALLVPPKEPWPEWLSNPELLPKKPPAHKVEFSD